jgi:hypothetical protein
MAKNVLHHYENAKLGLRRLSRTAVPTYPDSEETVSGE